MRFMVIRRSDKLTESGAMPTEEILGAMDKYIGEMVKAGVMRAGEGLKPSSQGARVNFSRGKPTVVDGPFTETKELIAGYSIIEVSSLDEAIAWTKRWPASGTEENVSLEIRPFYEISDFGKSHTAEPHAKLRKKMTKKSK